MIKIFRLPSFALVLFSILFIVGCNDAKAPSQQSTQKALTHIKIGIPAQPSAALLHIARANNFFEKYGIDVEFITYPSGKRALVEGLETGKVDFISAATPPLIWKSFSRDDLIAITSIHRADNANRIVARKDSGIRTLKDLQGKKIATQRNSAVHYFLHNIFVQYEMPTENTSFIYLKADELPKGLANNDFDAFSMREPYISQAKELLGENNVVVLESPGSYIQNDFITTTKAIYAKHEQETRAIIRALIDAEVFAANHQQESINMMAKAINIDPEQLRKTWNTFSLEVSLKQSMLPLLDNQIEWFKTEVFPESKTKPNSLDLIFSEPLREVSSRRVTVIE